MKRRIAAGFQNTVDFELEWDASIVEKLAGQYRICCAEIENRHPIASERDLILTLLYHMKNGSGSECLAEQSSITRGFAAHFPYAVTLGGTAVRAAIAIGKIGLGSLITVHACSLNRYFRRLMPEGIRWIASVPDEGEDFHPHVIVQYPAGARIRVNDIDITAKRPNRVIFTCDPPSRKLEISPRFAEEVRDAQVFLAASFNIIEDRKILEERMRAAQTLLDALPEPHIAVMEDGCFKNPAYRQYVTDQLAPKLDLFSMNEDELQDRFGAPVDILDPKQVADAVQTVSRQLGGPTLICHSACWALAYGPRANGLKNALEGGIAMASTRFRLGDDFGAADYEASKKLPAAPETLAFCEAVGRLPFPKPFLCIPCKDLSGIRKPVTIGLGDAFIGGMLPQLLPENLTKSHSGEA